MLVKISQIQQLQMLPRPKNVIQSSHNKACYDFFFFPTTLARPACSDALHHCLADAAAQWDPVLCHRLIHMCFSSPGGRLPNIAVGIWIHTLLQAGGGGTTTTTTELESGRWDGGASQALVWSWCWDLDDEEDDVSSWKATLIRQIV